MAPPEQSSSDPTPSGPVLGAEPGVVLHLTDLGATVTRLEITGGDGRRRNVVLGYRTSEEYLAGDAYLGASVGRYANRIARGACTIEGEEVSLGVNDRGNHLHGGPDGFSRRRWDVLDADEARATFRLVSPDGDQGFPGRLVVTAVYTVTSDSVRIDYEATTDAVTIVNLTNHTYFNLEGDGAGSVDRHRLTVHADAYTPVDDDAIPLGHHQGVDGSPFDLRSGAMLGDVVRADDSQLARTRGLDHNFVLDGEGERVVAHLDSSSTRTRLEVVTDQPGLQVYTGNFLDGSTYSSQGRSYRQGDGIALEPQLFPDTPNRPEFGSAVLRPGQTYRSSMEWRFATLAAEA